MKFGRRSLLIGLGIFILFSIFESVSAVGEPGRFATVCNLGLQKSSRVLASIKRSFIGPSQQEIMLPFLAIMAEGLNRTPSVTLSEETAVDRYDSLVMLKSLLIEFGPRFAPVEKEALNQLRIIGNSILIDYFLLRLNSEEWLTESQHFFVRSSHRRLDPFTKQLVYFRILTFRSSRAKTLHSIKPKWVQAATTINETLKDLWGRIDEPGHPLPNTLQIVDNLSVRSSLLGVPSDFERAKVLLAVLNEFAEDLKSSPRENSQQAGGEMTQRFRELEDLVSLDEQDVTDFFRSLPRR